MKQYPKNYKDLFLKRKQNNKVNIESLGSLYGDKTLEDITGVFQALFRESSDFFFKTVVRVVWLESHLTFRGVRRTRRFHCGVFTDAIYGYYMKNNVGIDQTFITRSVFFSQVAVYFKDMFPDFILHDPFKEPKYFKYPFKHVTIDFLLYVYQVDNKMELLSYADKKKMKYNDFRNWVNNYVYSYNDEMGKTIYQVSLSRTFMPYIKKEGWSITEQARIINFFVDDNGTTKTDRCDGLLVQTRKPGKNGTSCSS